jgi:HEAT repeat protein
MKQLILVVLGMYLATAYGQNAYKDSLVHEVDEYVKTVNKAAEQFLNKKLSPAERIKAIEPYSIIYDEEQAAQFKSIVLDDKELPKVRAMALNKIYAYVPDDERVQSLVIEWLGNPGAPTVLRYEALQLDENLNFASMEVLDVYQKMLKDPEPEFRLFAFTRLITHGDARAQQLLIKGLEDPKTALLPAPVAIEVLSMALKKEYYPTIYKVLQETKDESTRLAAIRALGFYKEARASIITISLSSHEKEQFREAALGALYAGDRDNIVNYVLPVLYDKSAWPRLQAIGIQMTIDVRQNMKYRVNAKKADAYDLLIKSIAEAKNRAPEVQSLAAKYIEFVRPNY